MGLNHQLCKVEFEKLRAIRANVSDVGDVGGVFTWVAC